MTSVFLRSRLRNAGSSLISHYFTQLSLHPVIFHTGPHTSRTPGMRTYGMWGCKQEYTQNVCWINKWKWQFEPQIWNCVTCNRHHWQTFSSSCVLSPIGGCWVILAVHVGPRHALLASSSFFIIFECHCNLRVGTWQASLTLSPCSMHLTPGPVSPVNAKRQPSEPACLCGSQALSFLRSATPTLFDTSNNFWLETVTAPTPTHLHCPFLFSPCSLTIHLTGL